MFTADVRVNELLAFIKTHNPNHLDKDLAADILTSQLTAGSQEYIDWIKKQTLDKEDIANDQNVMLSANLRMDENALLRPHHYHYQK